MGSLRGQGFDWWCCPPGPHLAVAVHAAGFLTIGQLESLSRAWSDAVGPCRSETATIALTSDRTAAARSSTSSASSTSSTDQRAGVDRMVLRQPAHDERLVDLVEVAGDVVALVVEDETQHVVGRVLLERAEVAGLVDDDAQIAHDKDPWKRLEAGRTRLKRVAGDIPASRLDQGLSASPGGQRYTGAKRASKSERCPW